ncbi:hypothetical protein [Niabella aurantiaca]|uniref:hypothetical protein n=1 Tax=Niabella aurantiaca TaxID=379900 RepID=UPI0012FCBE4C|nr:hypothetical protein [Niabella aurantiaca]
MCMHLRMKAQVSEAARDSAENERLAEMVTLSEVVINNRLNVPGFIDRVKRDTRFCLLTG